MNSSPESTVWAARSFRSLLRHTLAALVYVAMFPYRRVYQHGTRDLAQLILDSTENDLGWKALQAAIKLWSRSKEREAGYVQISGAVLITTAASCLSSDAFTQSHWSGQAFIYSSIALAVAAIFTGAQQALVLPAQEVIDKLVPDQMIQLQQSFAVSPSKCPSQLSGFALFTWQIPLMLLSYGVFSFLVGLCAMVYSPLAWNVVWGNEAKVAIVFTFFSFAALISWALPGSHIHKFDVSVRKAKGIN